MPAKKRVLVLDGDAATQGEAQRLLVGSGLIAIGGPCLEYEDVTIARDLRPDLILINIASDDARKVAGRLAGELPDAVFLAYRRGRDDGASDSGNGAVVGGRSVGVVELRSRDFVPAVLEALEAPPGRPASLPVHAVHQAPRTDVTREIAGEQAASFVRHWAELANDWLETGSRGAGERLKSHIADDVVAPFLGARGREAVLRALRDAAAKVGGGLKLVPGEAAGAPTPTVMIRSPEGRWLRAGNLIVRFGGSSAAISIDFQDGQ